jgi:hypothetical protein
LFGEQERLRTINTFNETFHPDSPAYNAIFQ